MVELPAQQTDTDRKRFEEIKAKAEKGDAEAQCNLAQCYDGGISVGITNDFHEAVKWYRKAADQGHVDAQYNLGIYHAIGIGIAKDSAEAAKWFRRAAEQGHVDSQYHLGVFFNEGTGLPKDPIEATKWFRKAAAQGDVNAEFNLGVHFIPTMIIVWYKLRGEDSLRAWQDPEQN